MWLINATFSVKHVKLNSIALLFTHRYYEWHKEVFVNRVRNNRFLVSMHAQSGFVAPGI